MSRYAAARGGAFDSDAISEAFHAKWRDPDRRRECSGKPLESLPYVTPALPWSFNRIVGRNGGVRWIARQVQMAPVAEPPAQPSTRLRA
jgi:hypothetical protein